MANGVRHQFGIVSVMGRRTRSCASAHRRIVESSQIDSLSGHISQKARPREAVGIRPVPR